MDYLLITTCLIGQVLSSVGDLSSHYRFCADECRLYYSCPGRFDSCAWCYGSCFRCRYYCMWESVDHFMKRGVIVPQFHGKWPFIAIHFSIFDSINIIIQVHIGRLVVQKLTFVEQLESHRMWAVYAVVGLLAWLCSAAYHANDCWFTEYLDYFSAFASILCASYTSFCFLLGSLNLPSNSFWNVYQHFDYGYNMRCCIAVSLFTTAMYILYISARWKRFRRFSRSDRILIMIIVWTNGSVIFETFDFPPIFWVFDAHSLFHAATIPLPLYLHSFLREHLSENEYRLVKSL
uniref:Post-GPI attachment to proteins factor 3 n=1 Tax=Angiostrongylus cantonensis TaxID=6313 RepID=A0A0K0CT96_ANGCA